MRERMKMEFRTLGQSGPSVGEIGYGAMGLTWGYGEPIRADQENEAIAVIHRAIDLGVTLFDTAEVYGPFTNEELLGKALKRRRSEVVVATKTGFVPHPPGAPLRRDGRHDAVQPAVEGD